MPEPDGLVATYYRIDTSHPVPPLPGQFRAFHVTDRRDPAQRLMAVLTRPELPTRPRITLARNGPRIPHAVLPIDYGLGRDPAGQPGWFVIAQALPGPPVGSGVTRWREQDLVSSILLPAASALHALAERGLTHRAINPNNLFRGGPRDPVTLGPFWAAPPASLQPAVYEPPYMARCHPNARGDGAIADDVYALGVCLLALSLGRPPLAGLTDDDILQRKMELGSYAALTADVTLTPLIADLLRGMLAEDPDHRPSPAMLLRPEQARTRRVAARPPRRAQLPLAIDSVAVWSARELAFALGRHPERGHALLKSGEVERWLRRHLGDPQLGMQVEETTRQAASSGADEAQQKFLLVMRAAAVIDPLSPLVWRGFAVQPDGIGPALVGASPDMSAALQDIVTAEAVIPFIAATKRRPEPPGLREEWRGWRAALASSGPAGGLARLTYAMNPLLACASRLLVGRPVVRVADLLPALDEAAATADRTRPPIDAQIAAFLAARLDPSLAGELAQLASFAGAEDRLSVLRLFGTLQARLNASPLPALSGWLVASGFATVGDIRHHPTRAALQKRVDEAAAAGEISTILALVDNEAARLADARGAAAAAARLERLHAALTDIEQGAQRRSDAAQALGIELVTGAGLVATLGAAIDLAWQW